METDNLPKTNMKLSLSSPNHMGSLLLNYLRFKSVDPTQITQVPRTWKGARDGKHCSPPIIFIKWGIKVYIDDVGGHVYSCLKLARCASALAYLLTSELYRANPPATEIVYAVFSSISLHYFCTDKTACGIPREHFRPFTNKQVIVWCEPLKILCNVEIVDRILKS
ncbi:hypothetical protein J6590_065906 [Homalodisca vitripennis]|nr:hypothetical protein J6590_065906 [Homalodisca vitripennis]